MLWDFFNFFIGDIVRWFRTARRQPPCDCLLSLSTMAFFFLPDPVPSPTARSCALPATTSPLRDCAWIRPSRSWWTRPAMRWFPTLSPHFCGSVLPDSPLLGVPAPLVLWILMSFCVLSCCKIKPFLLGLIGANIFSQKCIFYICFGWFEIFRQCRSTESAWPVPRGSAHRNSGQCRWWGGWAWGVKS